MTLRIAAALVVLAYLPGALLLRAPTPGRASRAALPAEEREFWAVALSLGLSSGVALVLAAFGTYTLTRVLLLNGLVAAGVLLWSRGDLRLPRGVPKLGLTAIPPALICALGLWLYTPPGELILGGKDPGVYLNEGVQIARGGSLVIRDEVVAAVPAQARDLFFPWRGDPSYHSLRFMGFFVLDPETGRVVGQFPHLYPVGVAFGYGLAGLPGARAAVTATALAGLLAVYFAGAWLLGRVVAVAGTMLLGLNVAQVWFGRYSNSELLFQALAFAGLLAWARALEGRGRLFAVLSASLIGLALFSRLETVLLVGAAFVGTWLAPSKRAAFPRAFWPTLVVWTGAAAAYYGLVMRPYGDQLVGFVRSLPLWSRPAAFISAAAAVALVAAAGVVRRYRETLGRGLERGMPWLLIVVITLAAAYAYFLRRPGGRLAPHDANALRTFAEYYVRPYGLLAAVAGFALATRRLFWRLPLFFLTVATFGLFFFYKVRIVPEHFWMARRFLPVILPASLLMVAAAALWPLVLGSTVRPRALRLVWVAIGSAFLLGLGWQFSRQSVPVRSHIEYGGATDRLERLNRYFSSRDLVIVESRQASDLHVLALPLAYVYGRNVLVLDSRQPDKARLIRFLAWAQQRYANVFFLGGGGTDLVDPHISVLPVVGERFQLPEYDSPKNGYPQGRRFKEFDFALYRFVAPGERPTEVVLDVGSIDDVYVVRFHAKERHARGETFRWTRDESYITLLPPPRATSVTLWMSDGGRPAGVSPARVTVYASERALGSVTVTDGFRPYRFEIPEDISAAWTGSFQAARLRIVSTTWNPRLVLGVPDDRDLGVMLDRLEIR